MARISKSTTWLVGTVALYGAIYFWLNKKSYKKGGAAFVMQGDCDHFIIAPHAIGLYFQRAQAALRAAFPDVQSLDQLGTHGAEKYASAIMKAIFPTCQWPPQKAITIGKVAWDDYVATLQEMIDRVGGIEAAGPEVPSVTELIAQLAGEALGAGPE